jgi:uncharacterized membrane protein
MTQMRGHAAMGGDATSVDLEAVLGRLLAVGTVLAIGLVAIGVVLMLATARSPLAGDAARLDVAELPTLIAAGRPEGFLWIGLIAAIATPVGRVAGALVGFLGRGERLLATVAAAILGVIGIAVVLAVVGV